MSGECGNCGHPVVQNQHGGWAHQILGVTYCHTQFPETLYNNWDNRVAVPPAGVERADDNERCGE